MSTQVIDRDLDKLDGLWADGLADAYDAYLLVVSQYETPAQPKLALAAALVEVGIRMQALGGRAAPAPMLLIGDLCLARASRLLADAASQPVQVAFASAIEAMSLAAAAAAPSPPARQLLVKAFEAGL
jgi:hypothetical protein